MKIETYLSWYAWCERKLALSKGPAPKLSRQFRAFRDHLIRRDVRKDAEIARLKSQIEQYKGMLEEEGYY